MIHVVPSDSPAWLVGRTGYQPAADFRGIQAQRGVTILGMVGFDHWTPAAAHMHVALAAPGGCRGLLLASFAYLFGECCRRLARGEVRSSNTRSLRLAEHLGFRRTGRVRGGWDVNEDLILLEMRREDCRWIGGSNG